MLDESSRVAGYSLRLTGHSLGAGCAAVLSFLLKSKFPHLRCLAFSPPGCTLSMNMAESCKDYLTSYILDTDIVPRLSFASMQNLRDGVLEMVARLKVTKYEAMHAKRDVGEVDRLLHRKEDTPPTKLKDQLDKFREHLSAKRSKASKLQTPLYPPGKIVLLTKTEENDPPSVGCCSCSGKVETVVQARRPYAARWAHRDDLTEIFISSHFLEDHKTINVLSELERVAEFFGVASPYTLDDEQ